MPSSPLWERLVGHQGCRNEMKYKASSRGRRRAGIGKVWHFCAGVDKGLRAKGIVENARWAHVKRVFRHNVRMTGETCNMNNIVVLESMPE